MSLAYFSRPPITVTRAEEVYSSATKLLPYSDMENYGYIISWRGAKLPCAAQRITTGYLTPRYSSELA